MTKVGAPPLFDPVQAEQFLKLLGKDPAQTRIRGFFEKHDPRKGGDGGRKASYSRQGLCRETLPVDALKIPQVC